MLARLYVDNYRCLVNFEFQPTRKQLIIGSNGTGKSTVLDVLSLLRDFSCRGIDCDNRLVGETKTRWQPGVEKQRFELVVDGNGTNYTYTLQLIEWGTPARPKVLEESVVCDGKPVFRFIEGEVHLYNDDHQDKVQYEFDWHRSALATIQERWDNKKLTWFKRWLGSLFHVRINPWAMSARSEQESREPSRDLGNFADWYRHLLLDNSTSVHQAISDLKEAIYGLESLDAKEAGLNVRMIQAGIRGEKQRIVSQYALNDLSDGQRAIIALYMLMHCGISNESTLLIDEPDNFLALAEIQPWLIKLLDRVEEQNAQIILVSHHPELLNQLAGQGGMVFDRPEGFHVRVKRFDTSDDSGLTPAEIVARGWESV